MSQVEDRDMEVAVQRFVDLLDKPGLVRLLDEFLTSKEFAHTQESLESITDLKQGTVSRRVRELVGLGIVSEIDETAPQQYRLNTEHPAVPGLADAHTELHSHVREIQASSEAYDASEADPNDGSPFVQLFRYPTNVKLLATFLRYPWERFQVGALAEHAGVDRGTAGSNVDLLCEVGIVRRIESRVSDRIEYELDDSHPAKEGFKQIIEAFLADEPAAPTDRDDVSASEGADRAESIRQQLSDLVGDLSQVEFEWRESDDWWEDEDRRQCLDEALEAYLHQSQANDVDGDENQAAGNLHVAPDEDTRDEAYRFGRRGFTGTGNHRPAETSTAAA